MSRRLEHDWLDARLPDNVAIGDGSWIHSSYAFIHYRSTRPVGLRIGRHCGVYVGTMFDIGPRGALEMGDHSMLVGAQISTNRRILIEDHALISFLVVLADSPLSTPDAPGGRDAADDDADDEISIRVGPAAWVGARAILLRGADLGEGAIVGAAAVVDFTVPAHAIVAGSPARIVGWARPRQSTGPAER